MTFQQLQYLLEVSRSGSISGAAKKLVLAQSSVSASISNLENELGFPIFIRSKKGVLPTVQGAVVIEQAARIWESYRVMTEEGIHKKEHIRISAPEIEPLDTAFVSLISHYAEDSSVSFSADTLSTAEAAQKLSTFDLDVAVLLNHTDRFLSVEALLSAKNLAWQSIATLPVVIQIGPSHPLYEKSHVKLEDFQDLLFVDNLLDPLVHNEYLKGIIRLTPENTVSVKSSRARNLLIAEGVGYSIGAGMPKETAQAMGIRTIPLKDVTYTVTVVTNPQRKICPAAETYIRIAKKAFEKM